MDDPNLVFHFIRGEGLNVLEELNLPMDEDFRDLLAVLINSYLSFKKCSKMSGQHR